MNKGITMKQGFTRALEDYRKIGDAEMVAFFEKRLEQANKKTTTERRLTPHQQENEKIKEILSDLDTEDMDNLAERGAKVRRLIKNLEFPDDLRKAIID